MAETNKIVDAVDYIKSTKNISSTHEATAKLRKLLYASLWPCASFRKIYFINLTLLTTSAE